MEKIKELSGQKNAICIKDVELGLKILNDAFKKDYKEDEIDKAIRNLIDTGKDIIIGLYKITMKMEVDGLYEKWQTIGLEVEILKFIRNIENSRIIESESTDDEDAFIAMLRGVYTMCTRYFDIVLAVEGKIIIGDKIIDYINESKEKIKATGELITEKSKIKYNNTTGTIKSVMINDKDGKKLDRIKSLIEGKIGKHVVLIIKAAMKKGWMLKPSFKQAQAEFGYIGAEQGYNKFFSIEFTKDEMDAAIKALE